MQESGERGEERLGNGEGRKNGGARRGRAGCSVHLGRRCTRFARLVRFGSFRLAHFDCIRAHRNNSGSPACTLNLVTSRTRASNPGSARTLLVDLRQYPPVPRSRRRVPTLAAGSQSPGLTRTWLRTEYGAGYWERGRLVVDLSRAAAGIDELVEALGRGFSLLLPDSVRTPVCGEHAGSSDCRAAPVYLQSGPRPLFLMLWDI